MSRSEQYSWASLLALTAVFAWFQMRMLDGVSIVDQPARKLLDVYLLTLVALVFTETAIASLLGARTETMDERDHAIEARANLNERLFLIAAVNVVIWQALMEGAFAGHDLPRIDLGRLPTLFFVLASILFAGEAVKRVSTIWLYRVQSARG